MEKLRRVQGAAARLIGGFRKFDHIPLYAECVALASIPTTHLLQDRVVGVAVLVRLGALLSARALPASLLMFRPSSTPVLCSRNLVVPFARSATMQTCSFSVVGPKTWNGLPADLRHLPIGACSQFPHLLKTLLFRLAWVGSASE